jgi:hypothetical protein
LENLDLFDKENEDENTTGWINPDLVLEKKNKVLQTSTLGHGNEHKDEDLKELSCHLGFGFNDKVKPPFSHHVDVPRCFIQSWSSTKDYLWSQSYCWKSFHLLQRNLQQDPNQNCRIKLPRILSKHISTSYSIHVQWMH